MVFRSQQWLHWKGGKSLKDTRQNSQEKWLQRIASYQIKVKQTDPNLETEKLSKVSHFDVKMNIGGQ